MIPFPLAAASLCLKAVVISAFSTVIIKFAPKSQQDETENSLAHCLLYFC